MGHSARYEAEAIASNLEAQAERMLGQASIVRGEGRLDIAEQILAQREKLLGAIAALRALVI